MGRTNKSIAYSITITTIETMTKRICTILLVLLFISGCSEPLRTLIRVNKEQESQHKYIAQQNNRFDDLVEDIETDDLDLGLSRKRIIARYGQPIYEKEVEGQMRLLYRQPIDYNPAKKVYLYLDADEKLAGFELVEQEQEPITEESEPPEAEEDLSEEISE